jgi:hypothetical protein
MVVLLISCRGLHDVLSYLRSAHMTSYIQLREGAESARVSIFGRTVFMIMQDAVCAIVYDYFPVECCF